MVNYEHGITNGGPYCGIAILWNKKLKTKTFVNEDKSIVRVEVRLEKRH